MSLWNCYNDALLSVLYSGAEPQTPFPIPPSAADPDNEQEQRQRVGEIYYAQGWRADWDPAFKAWRTR